jgi:hypothetical protein
MKRKTKYKTNKGPGSFFMVNADRLSELNTTTIKVEEAKVTLGNDEGPNEAPIWLLNENLPVGINETTASHK